MVVSLIAVAIVVLLSAWNWRLSVKTVLVLVVLEGALRKWVLPQASEAIYFLKDFVMIGAYTNYFGFDRHQKSLPIKYPTISLLVLLFTGWCIFQVFNPGLGSPIVGLFGLRAYLLYLPLMWMVPHLFQSEDELYRFLRAYLLLVIPIGLLGIAQFFSPPNSLLNTYTDTEMVGGVAVFGAVSKVRVTGTFSYISGFTIYLLTCFGLLIPMIFVKQPGVWRWVTVAELLLVVVNAFMNGSRGLLLTLILFLITYLTIKGQSLGGAIRLVRRFLIPTVIVTLVAMVWFQPAIDAFWFRTTANQDASWRIATIFTEPFDFIKFKQLDGYGTGATHQAIPALRKALNLPGGESIPTYYEGETGRIVLEQGPIGAFLWYALRISIVIALWQTFRRLSSPFLKELALSSCLILLFTLSGPLVFNHTLSVYHWFLAGFIFLLPMLEQRQQQYVYYPNG